jgi:hypothetical protein
MMEDKDVIEAKKLLNSLQLTAIEKATICKILGDWYTQLYQTEHMALMMKTTWEKIVK